MKYKLDLTEETKWTILTPTQRAKQLMMYITEAGFFCANKDYYTERTHKPEYFLMYVIEGEGILKRENQEVRLAKNSAIMVYCEEYQYWKTVSDDTWKFVWVHFAGPVGGYYYDMLNKNNIVDPIHVKDCEKLLSHLENIMRNPGVSDETTSILATMELSQALTLLISEKYSENHNKAYDTYGQEINAALYYIRNHYHEKIHLRDFENIVHMSQNYFVRIFKECLNLTPYDYILHYRIDKAKELLRSSNYSITQISLKVGFESDSNFIRYFKKITGKTPLKFRKTETTI